MTDKKKKSPEVLQRDLFSGLPAEEENLEKTAEDDKTGDLFNEEPEVVEVPPPEETPISSEVVEEAPVAVEVVEEVVPVFCEVVEEKKEESKSSTKEASLSIKNHFDTMDTLLEPESDSDDSLTLARFASKAYLEYAISVVKGRALPDICDGQKPVQRRILYAMRRMGLMPDAKQVKSARVVGDVLGKYHPHGDTAAYEAMVRMAQNFTMRYPLIDGHGNFGSRDGDGPAAMRYTEAKLTKYSELLLSEIDDGTVKFVPNYDGAFKEPVVLPSRMPFVLLNGSTGIAVGMSTDIPSHNMKEVAKAVALLIEKPEATLDEVLEIMPGPDFPGGSQVISSASDIREVYRTGYGSLQMRAVYHFEELARGQWQLVVTQLPYKVSAQNILSEIEDLTNPKPPSGKKTLSAKQAQEKLLMLNVLDKVRDESDKDVDVRLVFEPRSKMVNRDEFVNTLFAKTSLESSCKFNMIIIGFDGKPKQKGLMDVLQEWIQFRTQTVRKRTENRLEALENRIHILEGRLLILVSIDEVIRIVRESDDPKADLMARFALSDRQAEDILEIKLRQLAKMEDLKLEKELQQKQKEAKSLRLLLSDENRLNRKIIDELLADAEKYGDERRTLIEEAKTATLSAPRVVDEPVTVIISEKGFVRSRTGHGANVTTSGFKLGDAYLTSFECRSVDQLVLISNTGRVYSVPVSELPSARGDGTHISAFVQFVDDDQPVSWFAGNVKQPLLIASDNGMGFTCSLSNLVVRQKAGKTFFELAPNAQILGIYPVDESATYFSALSETGRLVVFDRQEVGSRPSGGKGVQLIDLSLGEKMVAITPCTANGVVVVGKGRGDKRQELVIGPRLVEEYRCRRARKGKVVPAKWKFLELHPNTSDKKAKNAVPAEIFPES